MLQPPHGTNSAVANIKFSNPDWDSNGLPLLSNQQFYHGHHQLELMKSVKEEKHIPLKETGQRLPQTHDSVCLKHALTSASNTRQRLLTHTAMIVSNT